MADTGDVVLLHDRRKGVSFNALVLRRTEYGDTRPDTVSLAFVPHPEDAPDWEPHVERVTGVHHAGDALGSDHYWYENALSAPDEDGLQFLGAAYEEVE